MSVYAESTLKHF